MKDQEANMPNYENAFFPDWYQKKINALVQQQRDKCEFAYGPLIDKQSAYDREAHNESE